MFKDVAGYQGFVNARVFVGFEVLKRIFRDAFMSGGFCKMGETLAEEGLWRIDGVGGAKTRLGKGDLTRLCWAS